jgi:glycosidase
MARWSGGPVFEFHVSRQARDRYQFDQSLFASNGTVLFANFRAAREFAERMNSQRDLARFPERAARASDLNAMGLIDEILHLVAAQYRQEINPGVLEKAIGWLAADLGADELEGVLTEFNEQFPPLAVYREELTTAEYLDGETEGLPHRQAALEELLMLWLANMNPAFRRYEELFDDRELARKTLYYRLSDSLFSFFDTQPKMDGQNLLEVLRAPALASPDSLAGQLEYLARRYVSLLGQAFLLRLLGGMDFIREESRIIIGTGGGGGESIPVVSFHGLEAEPERFSQDLDWMPSLVLIAKNSYVWLDQLSRQYQRPITRLDQIPDEELDRMARLGFTGLWLIGLWERSPASQRIKVLCGNPEAVASAYSLYDYVIAADLGGEEAYQQLKGRAWQRGLRLAADMVPNHVGIYSKWVVEHPDWFIALDYPPYPSYSFSGPDLSEDSRVGIFIEDHYYSRSDASVVFKRVDRWTGSERYIYHGNDGTSMPWNDTAQLNYLRPDVREAVIQTILHVARKFSVIRFDAAMTLAKRHFQRLWFPEPGSGGDIPTRSEYGLTKEQFNQAIPEEFWREVVDRVAREAPDTLLLAEAFWLMEGYFVRTLGMHRVYNSAFMNMLRDEKNAEYRLVIKNTLEFDPEILKRYVNFMNNPDEKTAAEQFGKGDKYFGIATLMATFPGLPMFGHGQVEGYYEKYGMEYRKAYYEEHPDPYLVERHSRQIAPLLYKRYLFAQVNDFLLYDFFTPEGTVNEDVFAYSNRAGDERALVLYHNRYAQTSGWVRTSAAYSVKTGNGDERSLMQKNLGEGLGLRPEAGWFTICRDTASGLEYLRHNLELFEQGMFVQLGAYQCHVFTDFRQVQDDASGSYARLEQALAGGGVASVSDALQELYLQPVHGPFKELVNAGQLDWLMQHRQGQAEARDLAPVMAEIYEKERSLMEAARAFSSGAGDSMQAAMLARTRTEAALRLPTLDRRILPGSSRKLRAALKYLQAGLEDRPEAWAILLGWTLTHSLGFVASAGEAGKPPVVQAQQAARVTRAWMDEWLLGRLAHKAFGDLGLTTSTAEEAGQALKLLAGYQGWFRSESRAGSVKAEGLLAGMLADSDVQAFIKVNRYDGVVWYNKEAYDRLLFYLFAIAVIQISSQDDAKEALMRRELLACWALIEQLQKAEASAGYQVEKLLAATGWRRK